jgi:hypothetical protein
LAITTRYFDVSGAGAADGTSHAARAALFSAGNWSTVISGHDFSTSSLVCRIEPGTYTCAQTLTTTVITTDPAIALPLILCGADANGDLLAVPEPTWQSCQPAWSAATLPVINSTTNVSTISLAACTCFLIKFTASGRNGAVIGSAQNFTNCVVTNTTSNSASGAVLAVSNSKGCVYSCSGAIYDYVVSGATNLENCRIEGVAGSSGNRRGVVASGTSTQLSRVTVVNNGGEGIICTSSSAAQNVKLYKSVVANNGAQGVKSNSTASQTTTYETHNSMITGNGTAGIDGNSDAARWNITNSRFRDNTTNIQGIGNYPLDLDNYTTDSDDATEYVGAGANGDFSIKNTATNVWEKGFGVRDEPEEAVGGGGLLRHPGMSGGLNG